MNKKKPKNAWVPKCPEYPDLTIPGSLSAISDEDVGVHHARLINELMRQIREDGRIKTGMQDWLYAQLHYVMKGEHWDDVFQLPGRRVHPDWSVYSPRDERANEILSSVVCLVASGETVTTAIARAAAERNVSFETARADYYAARARVRGGDGF